MIAMTTEPDTTVEVQRILDEIDRATKLLDKRAAVGFLEELISGCEALQEELNGEDDEDDEDEEEDDQTDEEESEGKTTTARTETAHRGKRSGGD
jgi:hypothetical protein